MSNADLIRRARGCAAHQRDIGLLPLDEPNIFDELASALELAEQDARRYQLLRKLVPLSMSMDGELRFRFPMPYCTPHGKDAIIESYRLALDLSIDVAIARESDGKA